MLISAANKANAHTATRAVPVRRHCQSSGTSGATSPATPATLARGPRYFTFREAFKAAGSLNPGASSRTIAKRVHGTVAFGDKPMDQKTVDKAAKACSADGAEQYSPVKRGRVPLYQPDLANVLVQVLLEARKSGIRPGRTARTPSTAPPCSFRGTHPKTTSSSRAPPALHAPWRHGTPPA